MLTHIFINYYHKFFLLLMIINAVLIIYYFNDIKRFFCKIKRRTWILLYLIILSSLLMKIFFLPHATLIFNDEYGHAAIALNIKYVDKYGTCQSGPIYDCEKVSLYNVWPGIAPLIYSLFFSVFGDNLIIANYVNIILSSISIGIFFLISYLLSKRENVSLMATLIFSLTPTLVKLSTTGGLETTSVFFILLASLFMYLFLLKQKNSFLMLFVANFGIAISVRVENILLVPLFGFFLIFYYKRLDLKKISTKILYLAFLIFAISLFFSVGIIISGLTQETGMAGWSLNLQTIFGHLKNHIGNNMLFLIDPASNLFFLIPLSIFGSFIMIKKNRTKLFILISSFLVYFLFNSSIHIGYFNLAGEGCRFSAVLYIPLVLLTIPSIQKILNSCGKKNGKKMMVVVLLFIFVVILAFFNTFSNIKNQSAIQYIQGDIEEMYGAIFETNVTKIVNPTAMYFTGNRIQLYDLNKSKYDLWFNNSYRFIRTLNIEELPPEFIFVREISYFDFPEEDFAKIKKNYNSSLIKRFDYEEKGISLELIHFQ